MAETITITVDGETVETTAGTSVLEAALNAGICIPNLCFLPETTPTGACRVCLVEVERHGRTADDGLLHVGGPGRHGDPCPF